MILKVSYASRDVEQRKSYPTAQNANSNKPKRGLPKPKCLTGYKGRPLNIRHGNRAFIVVGDRENLLHGKGRQVVI